MAEDKAGGDRPDRGALRAILHALRVWEAATRTEARGHAISGGAALRAWRLAQAIYREHFAPFYGRVTAAEGLALSAVVRAYSAVADPLNTGADPAFYRPSPEEAAEVRAALDQLAAAVDLLAEDAPPETREPESPPIRVRGLGHAREVLGKSHGYKRWLDDRIAAGDVTLDPAPGGGYWLRCRDPDAHEEARRRAGGPGGG